jgi:hypothetical protein
MSSGHASHKGPGVKQSHDSGQLDTAATMPGDPQDVLGEGEGYPFDEQGTQVNPAATERPSSASTSTNQTDEER